MKKWNKMSRGEKTATIIAWVMMGSAGVVLLIITIMGIIECTRTNKKQASAAIAKPASSTYANYFINPNGFKQNVTWQGVTYELNQTNDNIYEYRYTWQTIPDSIPLEEIMQEGNDIRDYYALGIVDNYPYSTNNELNQKMAIGNVFSNETQYDFIIIIYEPEKGTYQDGYNEGYEKATQDQQKYNVLNENSKVVRSRTTYTYNYNTQNQTASIKITGQLGVRNGVTIQSNNSRIQQYVFGGTMTITWKNTEARNYNEVTLYVRQYNATVDNETQVAVIDMSSTEGSTTITLPQQSGTWDSIQISAEDTMTGTGNIQVDELQIMYTETGYYEGYAEGFQNGYEQGNNEGYQTGFNQGYGQAVADNQTFNLDWLVNFANGFFNVQAIGKFTMGELVFTMLTIAVFGGLLKLFFGG